MNHQQHQAGQDAQFDQEQTQKAWCEDCEAKVLYLVGEDCLFCEDCKSPHITVLKEGE